MEQCEMSNNTLDRGSSTGGAISFSKGSPIVRSSTFKNNLHPALSSACHPLPFRFSIAILKGIIKKTTTDLRST
jgi:hypothetical protein